MGIRIDVPLNGQAYDRQSRLELSAEREKLLGQVHSDVAAKRAALWKLLDPQQKMALEDYESRAFAGHGRFHQGPRHGWNCPGNAGTPCPMAEQSPRQCPGYNGAPAPRGPAAGMHHPEMPHRY